MRNPRFQLSLVSLFSVILFALSGGVRAEPPPSSPAEPTKVSPGGRTKPQIIYHVRPASNYAATLHSQEKMQNNEVPFDSDMSSPRPKANEEARVQQQAPAVEPNQKRPKIQKSRGQRPQLSVKSKGHGGRGHGGKGPKH